ncbi:MAG: endonuclease/exonuclease/phosphatase family protein [Alistipes communis]|jgi:metal-dependent hydrolase|uniref:endonuclease/exonuclease/phosphatase family protein n=1 Tax=Alistipes TaxID=239759 RepID=UPI003040D924
MKRILTAAALLLVVAACNKDENYNDKYGDRAVIPPKGQSLRVMTYNIYGARATSPANAADLDAIAEVIRRQNPDFVTLNEVDVFTNRTGKDVHQACDLAEKLGMEWHFSKAIDRDGGEYGDAVLSKYPILEKRSYRLPCAAEQPGEDRSLCVIRVQIDGKDLYVASTHLDHLSGDASRLVQATEIRRIRDTELEGDLILCGDLNAIPSSNVIATMTSFLTNTGPIDQYTFPSDDPSRKIDYIMYAPIEHFGVQNCQVVSRGDQQVGGVDASDHRPVIADIRFQTEEDISGEDGGGEE